MQKGMLYHALSASRSGINIEQLVGTLREELDVSAFTEAWQRLSARHEALRTAFRLDEQQRVAVEVKVPVGSEDWRDQSSAEQALARRAWFRDDRARGFSLETAPLLRVTLFHLSEAHWEFVWTFHHALLDGRSIPPLIRELFAIYEALRGGTEPALARPRSLQPFYEWISQRDFAASQLFWKELLAGYHTPVSFASSRPLEAGDFTETLEARLPLIEALNRVAEESAITLNTIVQGAWALLLARYTRSDYVVFGTVRAGRPGTVEGAEEMIGISINTVPVRVRVPNDAALLPWLRELRSQHLAVRPHEHTPLVEIQKWSDAPKGTALFDTLLAFENYELDELLREPGGAWANRHFELLEKTGFPLTINLYAGRDLHVKVAFARARFTADQIARLLGHFETLLRAIIANPHATLGELTLLTEAEKHQLLLEWNQASESFPPGRSIHELFEAAAAATPNATALVYEQAQLTYAELNARANQLANYLRARGAGPETLIALSLERSLDLVVAILGILKAGAAYVPCDPELPAARLAFILTDTRAPMLVTEQSLLPRVTATAAEIICLDRDSAAIAAESAGDLDSRATPENVAYVIYTSGSTGQPKGVCVTHHNVVRLFEATDAWFHFGRGDVWTLFHSVAFDFSVWEIWGALGFGGRLVVVPQLVTRSPHAFHELLAREKVTVLNQTPSAFRQLIAADESAACASLSTLRYIVFGGEALELASLQPWFVRHGDAQPRLINMYGITETTVHVTYRPLTQADLAAPGSVIGRALPDLDLYVLDATREPCPIGVPGELHVGGAGLARGYLHRPELTAERFFPHPHQPGGRLYQTGDLARYLPNGDLEYLGRIDQQVKVRGFRIELGEIEAALSAHPAIREAAVLARADPAAGSRLIAYLVVRGAPPDVTSLSEHLRRSLPDYMVPAAFVFLDALPLTSNGKLDRRALPEPEPARPEVAAAYVEPRTPAEQALAAIWQRVLRLERVGVHDNFFELGGDSILSILIIAQARKAGLALNPKHLFDHQTIAGLAAVVPTATAAQLADDLTAEIPLTPIQHWFFEHDFAGAQHWNQSFIFQSNEPLEPIALSQAVVAVAQQHPALRFRYGREGERWIQRYGASAGADLCTVATADLATVAGEAQASLDLTIGPTLRLILSADRARVLIVAHHLCIDGVSWRILLEDLETAYRQVRDGLPIQLPAEATSFQSWAGQLRAAASAPALAAELPHWQALANFRPAPLPDDGPSGENTEASARTITAALTPAETDALLQRLPAATRTRINDALLTALVQTLSEWTGASSHLIDLEGHGREEALLADASEPAGSAADLARTIGWFTAIHPVRLDSDLPPGDTLLRRIREQLQTIPRRGLGYGILRYLAGHAELRTGAEVLFNYLGQFEQTLADSRLFRLASESAGAWHSPGATRTHTLEINCLVVGGQFEARWTFSENRHAAATVERLANRFTEALRELIAGCSSEEEDGHPLSPMQQLYHTLEAGRPNAGFDQWHFAIRGALDVARFHEAWRGVFRRHSILRTAFVAGLGTGDARQTVFRQVDVPLHLEDWRQLDAAAQTSRLAVFLQADQERGFDFARPPLTRLALLRWRDDEWRFVWSHHHLQIDGWSWPLLFREVGALYAGAPLAPARPYGDFVAWLESRSTGGDESFWRADLRGFTAATPLPESGARHENPGADFHEETLALPSETTAALNEFARRNQVTVNVLFQAAWALILSRSSKEPEVLFGASFSGRPAELPGVEAIAGPFVANLPVRVTITPAAPLAELLRQIQAHLFQLQEHQFTSLAQIQNWSELPWQARLFESLLVFQNYVIDESALRLGEEAVLADPVTPVRTNYPLTIVAEQGAQLRLTLIAATRRFRAQTTAGLRDQFAMLLRAMAAGQPQTLADLLALLPAPADPPHRAERRASANYVAPKSPTERAIAAVWQEAFGLDRVGVCDNFFDLGGHSLLMVRVHARLRDALKPGISLVRMFQHPTIQLLARHLDGDDGEPRVLVEAQARAERQKAALARQRSLARR
jgi:amino acid adenylation domain-containing protein/non-ribosomal peptide synthase protein (TIGR01720 family)